MANIDIPETIPVRYVPRSRTIGPLAAILTALGAVAFLFALRSDADRAWQAYVVNWLFFTSIALGAVIFAAATTVVKAKWDWSVKRIAMSFVAFLPISFLFFLPMLSLGASYFPWIGLMEAGDHVVLAKAAYLNLPFLRLRGIIGLLLLFGILIHFVRLALRPDMGLVKDHADEDAGRRAWRTRLTGNWRGQEVEEAESWSRMRRVAPTAILIYSLVMTVISIDWVMSLDAHWFSTIFGWWFFMGAFWGGMAATTWVALRLRKGDPVFENAIGTQQIHDLGKLCFAFSVFWTYLFWSQYIVIWYGKLPWEQHWIIARSVEPWSSYSLATIVLCFLIPFVTLISRAKLRTPVLLFATTVILAGLWLERYVILAPSVRPDGPALPIMELSVSLLFAGPFIFAVRWFLSTFPAIQLWKPAPAEEMMESEIIHPAHAEAR